MRFLFLFILTFASTVSMAQAGDYLVRRNTTVTDDIPDSGVRRDITYQTGIDSSGTTITYNPANGEWNLAETGKYVVLYCDQWGTTNTTDNKRQNAVYRIDSAGTEIDIARSSGYLRKRNSAQEMINAGKGLLTITTANTKIKPVAYRVDNVTGSTYRPSRIAAKSGMMVMKVDDSWNFARYEVTTDKLLAQIEGTDVPVEWQRVFEEDAPFTLDANDYTIDIASNNPIIAFASIIIEGAGTANARTDYHGRVNINGTDHNTSWCYVRNNSESCDDGCLSTAFMWDHTSGQDIEINVITNEIGTIGAQNQYIGNGSNLQLVELPASAKFIIVEANTGDHNSTADFTWDTEEYKDDPQFSTSQPSTTITVDSADSYLIFAGQFQTSTQSALRTTPSAAIKVNGLETGTIADAAYQRGQNVNTRGGLALAGLLPNLSANDNVVVYNQQLGTTGTADMGDGYFQMVKWGSLFGGGAPPSGWTGEINGIVNPAEINGAEPDEINGI